MNFFLRYFILFDNGALIGFQRKPETPILLDPLNNFTVYKCQVMVLDYPKPYTFILRGLNLSCVIERMFYAETAADREEWVTCIRYVALKLEIVTPLQIKNGPNDKKNSNPNRKVEMLPEPQIFEAVQNLQISQGPTDPKSSLNYGNRKVVSLKTNSN